MHKHFQAKIKHHYVWAKYLTRWSNTPNKVFYTTNTGKIVEDSVRGIAMEKDFYKVSRLTDWQIQVIKNFSQESPESLHKQHMNYLADFIKIQQLEDTFQHSRSKNKMIAQSIHAMRCNTLENLHSFHEKSVAKIIESLANKNIEILENDENIMFFLCFLGHQLTRTRAFKESSLRGLARRTPIEESYAQAMEGAWWFFSYMFGMNIGISMYLNRNSSQYAILVNDTDIPFITSDQPVINVHSCVSETELIAPQKADLYFPISPRIAFILCDEPRFASSLQTVDPDLVQNLNYKIARRAMVHIIGNSKESIENFQKNIGLSHKKFLSNQKV